MKKPLLSLAINLGLLVGLLVQGGCAAHKMTARWCDRQIVTDGHEGDWQGAPQYHDQDHKLFVRVTNDSQALALCVAFCDDALKRELLAGGLTLWFDPRGGEDRVFGIHLPGAGFDRRNRRPPPRIDAPLPAGEPGSPSDRGFHLPRLDPVDTLSISYQDATGPLDMTVEEVRHTGIDIAACRHPDGRLVYELTINFSAAPSLAKLHPGMTVGIGIVGGASGRKGGQGDFPGVPAAGLGGPGRPMGGAGPGGGSGGPGPGEKADPLEIWLQVRLALNPYGCGGHPRCCRVGFTQGLQHRGLSDLF